MKALIASLTLVSLLGLSACEGQFDSDADVNVDSYDDNEVEDRADAQRQEDESELLTAWAQLKLELDDFGDNVTEEMRDLAEDIDARVDGMEDTSNSAWAEFKADVRADMDQLEEDMQELDAEVDAESSTEVDAQL